jgi:hypothetical protein
MNNYFDKGVRALDNKKYEKAIGYLKKAGSFKEAYLNLGVAYSGMEYNNLARESYELAASDSIQFLDGRVGGYAMAENNLGLLDYKLGNDMSALTRYIKAIDMEEEYGDAHWNLAGSLLRLACSGLYDYWDMGWDEYEWRFKKSVPTRLTIDSGVVRRWQGESSGGVCILAEQGLGDQFMWGRYIGMVAGLVDRVVIQCSGELQEVFKAAGYETCFNVSESGCAWSIPMCTLAKAFGFGKGDWLNGIVGVRTFDSAEFNVGIVWRGSATHANDKLRSVTEYRFHRLAKHVSLWSLVPEFKGNKYIKPLECGSWLETLEAINGLDLVICVDTSVAHACGALGKPCWVLMPLANTDFRWGTEGLGEKNLWYPETKVYRNNGDWDAVFDNVERDIKDMCFV